jgi:hypothetical protein
MVLENDCHDEQSEISDGTEVNFGIEANDTD